MLEFLNLLQFPVCDLLLLHPRIKHSYQLQSPFCSAFFMLLLAVISVRRGNMLIVNSVEGDTNALLARVQVVPSVGLTKLFNDCSWEAQSILKGEHRVLSSVHNIYIYRVYMSILGSTTPGPSLHQVIGVGEDWGEGIGNGRRQAQLHSGELLHNNNHNHYNLNIHQHSVHSSEVIIDQNYTMDFELSYDA